MITMLRPHEDSFVPVETFEHGVWIRVVDPDAEEQETLRLQFGIDLDYVRDVLDIDEQSRIEKDGDAVMVIIRIPLHLDNRDIEHITIPFGMIIRPDCFVTIGLYDNPINQDIFNNRLRGMDMFSVNSVVLKTVLRSFHYFMRFLKDINRKTGMVEQDLKKAVKNTELARLLAMQKSLVFFSTSLRANEMLLEKIQKLTLWQLSSEELESLEDLLIEQKQAHEMCKVYTDILSSLMTSFSSIIANNLGLTMKRLTIVSLALYIPTVVASFFGMNVIVPLQDNPLAFLWVVGGSLVLVSASLIFFRLRQMY